MKEFIPLQTHCIIKVDTKEEKSKGGIVLSLDKSREAMAREEGIVVACGPDMYLDSRSGHNDQVRVGDRVAFARYAGKQLGEDNKGCEIRVMNDVDLLAKIVGEE